MQENDYGAITFVTIESWKTKSGKSQRFCLVF
jgi:hypothetical protein